MSAGSLQCGTRQFPADPTVMVLNATNSASAAL